MVGTYLCLALGGVLGVHARVEGDAVEAGGLGEGGEGTGEAREGDELVVAEGGHAGGGPFILERAFIVAWFS